MPPPTLHNTNTTAWASVSSQSVTRPTRSGGTAAQVGDLVVLAFHHNAGIDLATPAPTGFTFVGRADAGQTSALMVFYKYVGASEPTSYSVSYGLTVIAMLSATLVAGVRSSNPVAGTSRSSDELPNSTVVMASVTPDSLEVLILAMHMSGAGSQLSTTTLTPAAGWTKRYDMNSAALVANKRIGAMTYATQSAAGASASPSHTTSAGHANDATFAVAIATTAPPVTTTNRAAAFGLSLVMPTPLSGRAYQRAVTYNLGVSFAPSQLISMVRAFSLSAGFNASGGLLRVASSVERNLEAFMQILRGRRGTIPLTYRIAKSNAAGEDLGALRSWIVGTGSVSMSNFRDHAWELSFDMRQTDEIDPVRDYVKVYADVTLRGETMSYPLGLYRLRKPSGTLAKNYRTWACQGYSLEDLLARHDADNGYSVAKGQNLLQLASDIVVSKAGIPDDRVLIPAASAPARNAIQFDPSSDTSNANWLSISSALLNAAGYHAWQTDANGNFTTEKMGSRTVMRPDVHYDEAYERMVTGSIADAWDDDRFANKVVVRSQDVADTPPLVAKAFNRNPNSEGSIDYLGRVIQKTISLQTAATLADMQVMAQAELEKASGYYRKLSLTHLFDPRVFAQRRVYGLTLTDSEGETILDGAWNQINVSLPLSDPPSGMTSEVSRVEEVD